MTTVQANLTYYKEINEQIRKISDSEITVENVIGQRYLGCGMSNRKIIMRGTPGNGLGQYLDGATLEVFGNAQEAVGDTMNEGDIIIHGSVGDACGYGMRGGRIFIEGCCGYRSGIHMKAYQEHFPIIVIGKTAGSFLGEYQAGGLILVLGIGQNGKYPVNNFCGTGMHGGKIILRCDEAPRRLPRQVLVNPANTEDIETLTPLVKQFCTFFGGNAEELINQKYFVLTPNPLAGYKQLYTYEA